VLYWSFTSVRRARDELGGQLSIIGVNAFLESLKNAKSPSTSLLSETRHPTFSSNLITNGNATQYIERAMTLGRGMIQIF